MDFSWWHATADGRRPMPDVFDPITSAAFHIRCRAGEILVERRPGAPTRVFLDPVAQAARRNWRKALVASLDERDFPVKLHVLCSADWHGIETRTLSALLAEAADWTGLADGGAWASTRFDCATGTGLGRAGDPEFLAPIRAGITALAAGRYRAASTLLVAGHRRLGAREALLSVPSAPAAHEGTTTDNPGLDHHRLDDGAEPPRINMSEVADWIAETHQARTAIVAYSAFGALETTALLAVFPTTRIDHSGGEVPAVGVLRVPQPLLRRNARSHGTRERDSVTA